MTLHQTAVQDPWGPLENYLLQLIDAWAGLKDQEYQSPSQQQRVSTIMGTSIAYVRQLLNSR